MQRSISFNQPFWRQVVQLARPFNAASPLLASIIGYELAGGRTTSYPHSIYALILALLLVHSAATISNDLADVETDRANDVETFVTRSKHGRKVLHVLVPAMILLAVGLLLLQNSLEAVLFLFGLIALSWAYNNRPFRLSRRPLPSIITLALCYGLIPVLIGASLIGPLSASVLLFSLFYSFSRVAVSLFKDYKDINGDKATGKNTFLIRFGDKATIVSSNLLASIGIIGTSILTLAHLMHGTVFTTLLAASLLLGIITAIWVVRLRLLPASQSRIRQFDQLVLLQTIYDGTVLICLLYL